MLFWLLLAAMVPTDRTARLATAIGCIAYFVLTLSEPAPASSVPVTQPEVA